MKIERVESILSGNAHYVKITTDTGITGIGQSSCWVLVYLCACPFLAQGGGLGPPVDVPRVRQMLLEELVGVGTLFFLGGGGGELKIIN